MTVIGNLLERPRECGDGHQAHASSLDQLIKMDFTGFGTSVKMLRSLDSLRGLDFGKSCWRTFRAGKR